MYRHTFAAFNLSKLEFWRNIIKFGQHWQSYYQNKKGASFMTYVRPTAVVNIDAAWYLVGCSMSAIQWIDEAQ